MPPREEAANHQHHELREEVDAGHPHRRHGEQLAGKVDLLDQVSVVDYRPGRVTQRLREEVNQDNARKQVHGVIG
ncbi:hypothetical protein D9M72_579170 [compost metagenome]